MRRRPIDYPHGKGRTHSSPGQPGRLPAQMSRPDLDFECPRLPGVGGWIFLRTEQGPTSLPGFAEGETEMSVRSKLFPAQSIAVKHHASAIVAPFLESKL